MKRKISLLGISLLAYYTHFAQITNGHPNIDIQPKTYAFDLSIVDPTTGKLFYNTYPEVESGSPFFIPDWHFAEIKLKDGRRYDGVSVVVDIYKKQLNFRSTDEQVLFFPFSLLNEINIYDSLASRKIIHRLRSGFPKTENQNESSFYELLTADSILLLRSVEKKILEDKNLMSGEIKKRFETYEDYYVISNNVIRRLKKEKDFILTLFSNKKPQVESFVSANKLSYKKINDLIKIFDFYNSQ